MASTTMQPAPRAEGARTRTKREIGDAEVLIVLAAAMIISAALGLWFSRDTTFSIDELDWFSSSPNLDLRGALDPYTGHLILTSRLVYASILNAFGAGYLPFRLLTAAAVLLTAGVFFVFARRRVGALLALAPTLVLLFYGSDSELVIWGNGFSQLLPLAAGVGALLALDREDAAGDLGACLLLILAVVTYSEGLPYVAAAGVLILLGQDRWRRSWVFIVPAVLYAAWVVWSNAGSGGTTTEGNIAISNLLLVPSWAFNSLASAGAALLGLNYGYSDDRAVQWGLVIAVIALAALAWRLVSGRVSRWLWAAMTVPATFWLLHAAAADPAEGRFPQNTRYIFPATIAILLVAVEAARGVRAGRRALVVVYLLVAVSLATNIALLRDGSGGLRNASEMKRTQLTALEISQGRLGPRLQIGLMGPLMRRIGQNNVTTGYIEAVREFGSPAFSLPELRAQAEGIREATDVDVADAQDLGLQPTSAPARGCRRFRGTPSAGTSFRLPPGGATLEAVTGAPADVRLRRFGSAFAVPVGTLEPRAPAVLRIAADSAPDPWYVSASAAGLKVCDLPGRATKSP